MSEEESFNAAEYQQYAYSTEFLPTAQGFRITIKVRSNTMQDIIDLPFTIWKAQLERAKKLQMTLAPHMEPEDPDEVRRMLEQMKDRAGNKQKSPGNNK